MPSTREAARYGRYRDRRLRIWVPAPKQMVVAPSGRFAFVPSILGLHFSKSVAAYTIDSTRGTLTPVVRSPYAAGNNSYGVAVDSASKFAYVTSVGTNSVYAYTINASSGALKKVKGSPYKAGTAPVGLSVCRVTLGKCIPSLL
jgi:6-phosphogluconolactonase